MAVQYAFGKIVIQGLDLNVDAADPTSYPGTGTSWTSVVNRSITGSVVSCSFSSDFKGGIVFDNPSASVEFPGTLANYGTGSFAISTTFKADHFSDKHYLFYKNSGSYPNLGLYLSGSGTSANMFLEANYSAAASSSVSASYTFYTGSVYDMTFNIIPQGLVGLMYIDGESQGTVAGSGSQELGTGSVLLGNDRIEGGNAFSGSIFNTKIYQNIFSLPKVQANYPVTRTRFGLPNIGVDVGVLDPDYQAVLDYATSQGYSLPSTTQQRLDNTLVTGLKQAGYWTQMDQFFVFAHPTSRNFAEINWRNPGGGMTIPGTFTYTPGTGIAGDGSNRVTITSISASANNSGLLTWIPTSETSNHYFQRDNYNGDGNAGTIWGNSNQGHRYRRYGDTADLSGTGFKAFGVSSGTVNFYNNANKTTLSATTRGIDNTTSFLWFGSFPSGYRTSYISIYGIGSGFTYEGALMYTAILEYMTNIS